MNADQEPQTECTETVTETEPQAGCSHSQENLDSGTPTIVFRSRRRSPLSLSLTRNRRKVKTDLYSSYVDLIDIEVIDLTDEEADHVMESLPDVDTGDVPSMHY